MKIVSFNGSPRKKGNTAKIISTICKEAEKNGHKIKNYNIYDLKLNGCLACMKCKETKDKLCVENDRMKDIYPEIISADLIIIGSPIYFGHITGPLKTFIDRFYPFINPDFSVSCLPDKKIITVLTSGAPEKTFCEPISEFFKTWFLEFFKMDIIEQLNAGDLRTDLIMSENEIIKKAERLGKSL